MVLMDIIPTNRTTLNAVYPSRKSQRMVLVVTSTALWVQQKRKLLDL